MEDILSVQIEQEHMCNTNEVLDNIAALLGYIEEVGFDRE